MIIDTNYAVQLIEMQNFIVVILAFLIQIQVIVIISFTE